MTSVVTGSRLVADQSDGTVVEVRYDVGVTGSGEARDAGDPRIDTMNFLFGFVF